MMQKLLVIGLFLAVCGTVASQQMAGDQQIGRNLAQNAWYVYAFDDDVDATFELIADLDAYANLSAADKVEAVYGGAEDSARVHVMGIKPDSTRKTYILRVNGTTASTTSDSLLWLERAWIDSTNSGATNSLTLRKAADDVTVTTLTAGAHHSYIAQRFDAKNESNYITQWSAEATSNTGRVTLELRLYQEWADVLDIADEFTVIDACTVALADSLANVYIYAFDPPVRIPDYGVALIVGSGSAANSDARVKMSGYVTRP